MFRLAIIPAAFALLISGIPNTYAQVSGCTDPKSPVFNPNATINDGSCTYGPTQFLPEKLGNLPDAVKETSGLMWWNGLLWTHNDSGFPAELHALDPETRAVVKTVFIANASSIDWEDITRDESHCYIGDFGNNNGTRTNLRIHKIKLDDLENDTARAEMIAFSYADQTDFSSRPNNNDFDAEALISVGDSLYIFSKNWVNLRTRIYALPKQPGTYSIAPQDNIYADGMISGADFNPEDSVLILTGYNRVLQPFIWLLWDFREANFFSGNKRKINFNLPFHQVEGIIWREKSDYWITNEAFSSFGNTPAALYRFSTDSWIGRTSTSTLLNTNNLSLKVYPNPFRDSITVELPSAISGTAELIISSISGQEIFRTVWPEKNSKAQFNLSPQLRSKGKYLITLTDGQSSLFSSILLID